jgi:hypothetical protein
MLVNSYGVKYERGPLYLGFGHEIHHDFFAGSNSFSLVSNPTDGSDVRSHDTATRGTVMLKFGGTRVSLDVSQLELKETGVIAAGNFTGYKSRRYAIGAEQKFGNITGAVSVVNADKGSCTLQGGTSCSTAGLEGRLMNLGGRYDFSRRTYLFALYSKLTNGTLATFSNIAINANPGGAADPQAGEDVTAIGVGVSHSF